MNEDDSILDTVKKLLGFEADYTAYDLDITMHINAVFTTLNQLGIGPADSVDSFVITGNGETWTQFLGTSKNLNSVKILTFLKVRVLFDPPTTSFAIDAINKQIEQLEWRLNVEMEGVRHPWVDPLTTSLLTTE